MKANDEKMWYDAAVVMRNVPELMGLSGLQRQNRPKRGYQWVGPYRLSGERYGLRKDKLKVYAGKGSVWVQEEGEKSISIQKWLVDYGGCADYRSASRALRNLDPSNRMAETMEIAKAAVVGKYIALDAWARHRASYGVENALYQSMCRYMGEESVKKCFEKYMATAGEGCSMVYWYVDVCGQICHDKVMVYAWDGHRDKTRGGWRKYTTAMGYTNRCYYGSHLLAESDGPVCLVEGEKTAMLCSMVWPECTWLATGGKNQLSDVEPGWLLFPDIDAIDDWTAKARSGIVVRWWEAFDGEVGEHSDLGDMIEAYGKAQNLEELRLRLELPAGSEEATESTENTESTESAESAENAES